jgi:hypothetical protein
MQQAEHCLHIPEATELRIICTLFAYGPVSIQFLYNCGGDGGTENTAIQHEVVDDCIAVTCCAPVVRFVAQHINIMFHPWLQDCHKLHYCI